MHYRGLSERREHCRPYAARQLQPLVMPFVLPRNILQPYALTSSNGSASVLNSAEELGMVLQSILEPVFFRLEADQHSCWTPVPGDDNLLLCGQP